MLDNYPSGVPESSVRLQWNVIFSFYSVQRNLDILKVELRISEKEERHKHMKTEDICLIERSPL